MEQGGFTRQSSFPSHFFLTNQHFNRTSVEARSPFVALFQCTFYNNKSVRLTKPHCEKDRTVKKTGRTCRSRLTIPKFFLAPMDWPPRLRTNTFCETTCVVLLVHEPERQGCPNEAQQFHAHCTAAVCFPASPVPVVCRRIQRPRSARHCPAGFHRQLLHTLSANDPVATRHGKAGLPHPKD